MEINRNNVEAYLLDLLEGRLSVDGERKLREFLALNPDCDPGLEKDDLRTLTPEALLFPGKDGLRKEFPEPGQPVTRSHFDLFSVARLEGDLTEAQVGEHQRMMEGDPHLSREWEEWTQTRLPGVSVSYPGKTGLRKPVRRGTPLPWITILSSAAALVLVLLLITLRSGPSTQLSQETVLSPSGQEREEMDPPLAPRPPQDPIRAEVPAEGAGRSLASAVQEEAGTESADREETDKKPIVHGETDRLSEANITAPTVSSLGTRLAATLGPAPVPEGTYDRIRPIHLPPVKVHTRSPGIPDLADLDLQEAVEAYAEEKNLSLFSIASAGIRGINRITGSDIELYAAKDDEGEISGFQFKSKRLNISTPLQKPE